MKKSSKYFGLSKPHPGNSLHREPPSPDGFPSGELMKTIRNAAALSPGPFFDLVPPVGTGSASVVALLQGFSLGSDETSAYTGRASAAHVNQNS